MEQPTRAEPEPGRATPPPDGWSPPCWRASSPAASRPSPPTPTEARAAAAATTAARQRRRRWERQGRVPRRRVLARAARQHGHRPARPGPAHDDRRRPARCQLPGARHATSSSPSTRRRSASPTGPSPAPPNVDDLTGGRRTVVFASKTPDLRGATLTSGMDIRLRDGDLRLEREGAAVSMKIQAKDCAQGGIFQMEPEREDGTATVFTHRLAPDVVLLRQPQLPGPHRHHRAVRDRRRRDDPDAGHRTRQLRQRRVAAVRRPRQRPGRHPHPAAALHQRLRHPLRRRLDVERGQRRPDGPGDGRGRRRGVTGRHRLRRGLPGPEPDPRPRRRPRLPVPGAGGEPPHPSRRLTRTPPSQSDSSHSDMLKAHEHTRHRHCRPRHRSHRAADHPALSRPGLGAWRTNALLLLGTGIGGASPLAVRQWPVSFVPSSSRALRIVHRSAPAASSLSTAAAG